jgi:hypothetical protein
MQQLGRRKGGNEGMWEWVRKRGKEGMRESGKEEFYVLPTSLIASEF